MLNECNQLRRSKKKHSICFEQHKKIQLKQSDLTSNCRYQSIWVKEFHSFTYMCASISQLNSVTLTFDEFSIRMVTAAWRDHTLFVSSILCFLLHHRHFFGLYTSNKYHHAGRANSQWDSFEHRLWLWTLMVMRPPSPTITQHIII